MKISKQKIGKLEYQWPTGYHDWPKSKQRRELKKLALATGGQIVGSVVKVESD